MYAITGNEEPRLLVGAYGYTYSMPTDACNGGGGGSAPSPAPSGSTTEAAVTQGPGSDGGFAILRLFPKFQTK